MPYVGGRRTAPGAALGEYATWAPDVRTAYDTWKARTIRQRGVVTVMPNGPHVGLPGARYVKAGTTTPVYLPAPDVVLAAARRDREQLAADIAAGKQLDRNVALAKATGKAVVSGAATAVRTAGGAVKETLEWAGDTTRSTVSAVTGIPKWAIPVAVVGIGALVLRSLVGGPAGALGAVLTRRAR